MPFLSFVGAVVGNEVDKLKQGIADYVAVALLHDGLSEGGLGVG